MNLGIVVSITLTFSCYHALEDFDQARDLYNQGLGLRHDANQAGPFFKQSSETFRRCAGHSPKTPTFFREWAAAELLAKNPAHALMVSRQGLRLYPCDAQLLKISRWLEQELALDERGVSVSFGILGSRTIFLLLAVFNLIGWIAIFLARGGLRKLGLFLVCGCLVYAGAVIGIDDHNRSFVLSAIVAENPIFLKVGNELSYSQHPGPALKPGTAINILNQKDEWFLVSTATGRFGWVMAKDILIDLGN